MLNCDFNKLRYGCSPVNLLHIFRTPFPKNTSGGLLLAKSRNVFWTQSDIYDGTLKASANNHCKMFYHKCLTEPKKLI